MTLELNVDKLKSLICIAADLNEPVNYFFDMLDANILPSTTINKVESKDLIVLLKIAEETINKHFNLKIHTTTPMLEQTKDKQIIHGICRLSNGLQPLTIIYLVELKTAVICLYHKNRTELWRLVLSDKPFVIH